MDLPTKPWLCDDRVVVIAPQTMKVHVRNIMKKLHATNRTQVTYLATQLLEDSDGNACSNEGQANGKVLLTDPAHG